MAAWGQAIPARVAVSRLVTVMYGLDGAPRFNHVWAHKSFEDRLARRAEAVEKGVWPARARRNGW